MNDLPGAKQIWDEAVEQEAAVDAEITPWLQKYAPQLDGTDAHLLLLEAVDRLLRKK